MILVSFGVIPVLRKRRINFFKDILPKEIAYRVNYPTSGMLTREIQKKLIIVKHSNLLLFLLDFCIYNNIYRFNIYFLSTILCQKKIMMMKI